MSSSAVYLNELGVICALGADRAEVREGLFAAQPGGLRDNDAILPGRTLALGEVHAALPDLSDLPVALRGRNNGLLEAALGQIRVAVDAAVSRFGTARVAVIIGTSTSGIGETEPALRARHATGHWPESFAYAQQEMGSAAAFVRHRSGATGPAWTLSTACSSGAKALASAARLLRAGIVDAVIAGGADSLCRFTVAGFNALESISDTRCLPFSATRAGINIGEGSALFLLTREPGPVQLAGWGESSDAHHMSAPEPSGAGAIAAMREALDRAGWAPTDVDYINLHGTATPANDRVEGIAVNAVFGSATPCSSTKGFTGHTLGAAGITEAVISLLCLEHDFIPGSPTTTVPDPAIECAVVLQGRAAPLATVMSNSFGFGGSNCVLLFGKDTR